MTEKITRARAAAAVTHLADVARDGTGWYECCEKYAVALRSYLAQQPSEDVVRKAHEALIELRDVAELESTEQIEWIDEQVESILAALPPLPEEK